MRRIIIGIMFLKILQHIEFHVATTFGSEAVDGVDIADRFQRSLINTSPSFSISIMRRPGCVYGWSGWRPIVRAVDDD